jgi:hypothetical protein
MLQFASLNNPIGPDVISADTHELILSGTKVRFKAPPHSGRIIEFEAHPKEYNIYDESIYIDRSEKGDGFDFLICYSCEWGVHGLPFIQRHIGKFIFAVNVLKTKKQGSFLQPSCVEKHITEYIKEAYGDTENEIYDAVDTRLNWSVSGINQHVWLTFETEIPFTNRRSIECHLPLTDDHMLRVSIICDTYHKKAKLKPYFQQLCQQLIASFEVELSGDALLQQQRAKERWPEERYSDYLPPFHWQPEHRETSLFARSSTLAE